MKEISLIANAKLNLYLDITGKRSNGYHSLETVMQSIDLSDVITVSTDSSSDGINITCSSPLIPVNRKNICYKAAEAFYAAVEREPRADIHIEKRIPHAAGLGGGSADAAAVLIGLNTLFENPLGMERLLSIAEKTGADVPFCMTGGVKLCKGIGEDIHDIEPLPERVYLVVMPDFYCDTRGAYMIYDENPLPRRNGLVKFLKAGEEFPQRVYNVFKEIYENDRIDGIVEKLSELGAEGANLSGSGSAVFGIFKDEAAAAAAAREFPKYFTAVCKPVDVGIITIEN